MNKFLSEQREKAQRHDEQKRKREKFFMRYHKSFIKRKNNKNSSFPIRKNISTRSQKRKILNVVPNYF